jgi:fructokinase
MTQDRALVLGEALIDAVVRADGSVDRHPGGSPMNVAIGLGRLGRQIDLLSWLADDADGALIRAHLEASAVRLLTGATGPDRTSVATAHLDPTGAATYVFDLAWDLPEQYPGQDDPPLVVHTGSIAALLPPGAARVERELARHRATSTLTYDPNVRPSIIGPAAANRPAVERLVGGVDVVKVSDEDLTWLYPGQDPAQVAEQWARSGPGLVVVTLGGDGALARTADGVAVRIGATPVRVADTVGAGDSFMGGLIDGLWSAGLLGADRRAALRAVPAEVVEQILRRCARIAAITVSRPGANPPTSAELD